MNTVRRSGIRPVCAVLACALLFGALAIFTPGQAFAAEPIAVITREKAVEAALNKTSGTVLSLELDADGGRIFYDISIMDESGYRNTHDIDARTGEIIRTYKKSQKKVYSYQSFKNPNISWSAALEAARTGVANGRVWSFEMDRGWDKAVYEVKMTDAAGFPCTVKVDAATGEVTFPATVQMDVATGQVLSFPKSGDIPQNVSPAVTPARAEQIALDAMGGGLVLYCGLDYDDGVLYFEIDAVNSSGVQYEFKIDATTGAVLEQDREGD